MPPEISDRDRAYMLWRRPLGSAYICEPDPNGKHAWIGIWDQLGGAPCRCGMLKGDGTLLEAPFLLGSVFP